MCWGGSLSWIQSSLIWLGWLASFNCGFPISASQLLTFQQATTPIRLLCILGIWTAVLTLHGKCFPGWASFLSQRTRFKFKKKKNKHLKVISLNSFWSLYVDWLSEATCECMFVRIHLKVLDIMAFFTWHSLNRTEWEEHFFLEFNKSLSCILDIIKAGAVTLLSEWAVSSSSVSDPIQAGLSCSLSCLLFSTVFWRL